MPPTILSPHLCKARYQVPDLAAGNNLSLHINETTLSFPLEASKAQEVTSALNELLQTFKDKQAAERPKRWKPMEYRHKGARSVFPPYSIWRHP